jgi:PhoPQ-activated pathogenicity-related protein
MDTRVFRTISFGLVIALSALLGACTQQAAEPPLSPTPPSIDRTALDEYVAKPDPAYRWELAGTIKGEGYTAFILDMKSQTWRSKDEVDRTLWQHWVTIVKPDEVKTKTCLMLIGHRDNDGKVPDFIDEIVTKVALGTGAVVAHVGQVPNQPLTFAGETEGRTEDDQIAYAWDKVMNTGDPLWASRLPMVKATVRAMDATQAFLASEAGGGTAIDGFVVAGASKRGWTTYLTAAVDKRVVAIIPIVIDVLNVVESMKHHHAAYGDWAPSLEPYLNMDIMSRIELPEFKALMDLVDPYEYLGRVTMPKYVINATGDQLFLPDASRFYYDGLQGPKQLRYVPNSDHFVDEIDSVLAYFHAITTGAALPETSWAAEEPGTLRVTTNTAPEKVLLWQATNPGARDFRLETIGQMWSSSPVEPRDDGAYIAQVAKPENGWTAFFVEMTYDLGAPVPFVATTEVQIIPDVYPDGSKPPK